MSGKNAPERHLKFVVPEGTAKVAYERDTKVSNAGTFTIQREDHTLGNVLRMQLHRDPAVLFAGYQIPHPLEHRLLVKVQTSDESSPGKAVDESLSDLQQEFQSLKKAFQDELAQHPDGLEIY